MRKSVADLKMPIKNYHQRAVQLRNEKRVKFLCKQITFKAKTA